MYRQFSIWFIYVSLSFAHYSVGSILLLEKHQVDIFQAQFVQDIEQIHSDYFCERNRKEPTKKPTHTNMKCWRLSGVASERANEWTSDRTNERVFIAKRFVIVTSGMHDFGADETTTQWLQVKTKSGIIRSTTDLHLLCILLLWVSQTFQLCSNISTHTRQQHSTKFRNSHALWDGDDDDDDNDGNDDDNDGDNNENACTQ